MYISLRMVKDGLMKWIERIIFVLGVLVILFGLVMIAGGLINFFDSARERPASESLILMTLLGLGPVVCGFLMCRNMKRKAQHRKAEHIERQILQLAKENQGQLTISEVSMRLTLSSTEAKAVLDQCHLNHLAELSISDSGVVVYRFQML